MDDVSQEQPMRLPDHLAGAWRDLGEVLAISFPIIVAMASHTAMGSVDTWLLSGYGPNELASVGAAGSVVFTFIAFVFGTANCNSAFVSQSMGRGQLADCARYTWQGFYFALIVQVLAVPVALSAPLIFGAFGHEADLQGLEGTYFRIRLAHVAGTAAYASLTSFFQGIGRPVVPMVAALIANLLNALMDCLLIYGMWGFPELGIAGAGLATVVASYLQVALLLFVFLRRPTHERFGSRHTWRFDLARFRQLMRIGSPAGLSFMLHVASWAVFTNVLIGRLGRNILAANNVTHAICGLSFMPALGLNKGVTVLVGQYIGRKDIPAAKRRAYVGIALAMLYMFPMGLLFVVFRRPIMSFFSNEPEIVHAGGRMLILAAVFQAFDALGLVSHGALRGAGDTRFPAVIDIAAGWFLLLPLGYVLTFPLRLGYVGAWSAAAIEIAIVGVIFFWRFVGEAWRKIDIFAGTEPTQAVDDHPAAS